MVNDKKSKRMMQRNMEGMDQRLNCLEEHNTYLINENNQLKEDNMKLYRFVKGLEWDIEAICAYLEKKQNKNETDY